MHTPMVKFTDIAGDNIEVSAFMGDFVFVSRRCGADAEDYVHVLVDGAKAVDLYKALKKQLRATGRIPPKKEKR